MTLQIFGVLGSTTDVAQKNYLVVSETEIVTLSKTARDLQHADAITVRGMTLMIVAGQVIHVIHFLRTDSSLLEWCVDDFLDAIIVERGILKH